MIGLVITQDIVKKKYKNNLKCAIWNRYINFILSYNDYKFTLKRDKSDVEVSLFILN